LWALRHCARPGYACVGHAQPQHLKPIPFSTSANVPFLDVSKVGRKEVDILHCRCRFAATVLMCSSSTYQHRQPQRYRDLLLPAAGLRQVLPLGIASTIFIKLFQLNDLQVLEAVERAMLYVAQFGLVLPVDDEAHLLSSCPATTVVRRERRLAQLPFRVS
jgi:hypothetical protein